MGMTASLNDLRVTSARVTIGVWGCWYAEASIDGEHALTGSVALKISDLTLKGTVLSGGPMKGRSSYRIVSGAGGWGRVIPEKAYASDAGVKVSTVLTDAAREVGETISLTTTERTGPAYTRDAGPASRSLESIAQAAWYVGEDGVTRLGRRPTTTLTTAIPRVSPVDLARSTVALAPEKGLAALVPGIVVDGIEALDVVHEVTPEGVRTTIYGGPSANKRIAALRALFDQFDPDRNFRAIWEYRVVTQEVERLNLQPVLVSSGMPSLKRVRVRPGIAGCRSDVMLGSYVLVAFVNGSRGRPEVVNFQDAEGAGFTPLLTSIDASTFVDLADGVRLMAATGDTAGGIFPIVGTTRVRG